MSIGLKQSEVTRVHRELAALRKQDTAEAKKEVALSRDIDQTTRSLSSTRSDSMARSYQQKLLRLGESLAKVHASRASIVAKIADKTSKLHQAERALASETEKERKKVADAEKRREKEQIEHQRQVSRELERQRFLRLPRPKVPLVRNKKQRYDAFICHASEDKEAFVRPLAEALKSAGYDIWYDESSLSVGDSLRQNIDKGLAASRYGIVVLSSAFFSKNWPQYELNGLVAREMESSPAYMAQSIKG